MRFGSSASHFVRVARGGLDWTRCRVDGFAFQHCDQTGWQVGFVGSLPQRTSRLIPSDIATTSYLSRRHLGDLETSCAKVCSGLGIAGTLCSHIDARHRRFLQLRGSGANCVSLSGCNLRRGRMPTTTVHMSTVPSPLICDDCALVAVPYLSLRAERRA
jgi:hypothetical protein